MSKQTRTHGAHICGGGVLKMLKIGPEPGEISQSFILGHGEAIAPADEQLGQSPSEEAHTYCSYMR